MAKNRNSYHCDQKMSRGYAFGKKVWVCEVCGYWCGFRIPYVRKKEVM